MEPDSLRQAKQQRSIEIEAASLFRINSEKADSNQGQNVTHAYGHLVVGYKAIVILLSVLLIIPCGL